MQRSSLIWKLYLGYVAIVLIVSLSAASLATARLQRDAKGRIEGRLQSEAVLLEDLARSTLAATEVSPERIAALQTRVRALGEAAGIRISVIDPSGVVLADSREDPARMDDHSRRLELLEAGRSGVGRATRYSDTLGEEMMYVARAVSEGGRTLGFVRVSVSLAEIQEQLEGLSRIVLLGAGIIGAVTLLLGLFLSREVARPLSRRTEEAESQAADERNRLAAIVSSMAEGVVAVDDQENVVHMNDAARTLLGVGEERVVGLPVWKIVRLPQITDAIHETVREGAELSTELTVTHRVGRLQLELQTAPLLDDRRRSVGAVLVLHDVTRLRSLEAMRRDFVANVSHELKTPLAAIRGLVETILADPDMPEVTKTGFLGRVQEQTFRLVNLVSDLLALARFESQDVELERIELDLRRPLRESMNALGVSASGRELKMGLELPEGAVMVEGDPEALRQVFDNLLSNAIKYTPDGGRVEATMRIVGDGAVIEVKDTGIGMEPRHLGRIFERFYRVDKARSRELGGTGLGLSIVRHIVVRLGGSVDVQSRAGEGSVFRVHLPLLARTDDFS